MLLVCRAEQQQSRGECAAGDDDEIRAIEFRYAISLKLQRQKSSCLTRSVCSLVT